MLNDDDTLGRILTRREAVAVLGASGLLFFTGRGTSAQGAAATRTPGVCVVRPEQTEGPYFVDEKLHR